ncbi:hypothetical protein COP2_009338 [Malus domestica]
MLPLLYLIGKQRTRCNQNYNFPNSCDISSVCRFLSFVPSLSQAKLIHYFLAVVFSYYLFCLYVLALNREKLNSMNLLLYMSPIAVLVLLPAALIMEPNVVDATLECVVHLDSVAA